MYYSSRRSSSRVIGLIVVIVVVAIIVAIPLCSSYFTTKTYTVTVTDKEVKNYSDSSTYLVFTKLDNGETKVFEIEDSLFKLRFDSSDVYAQIEIDKTYQIEVIGWRIPFFSEYENIMTFREVVQEE